MAGELRKDSVAPKSYKDGLIGGKIIDDDGELMEGCFGGGFGRVFRTAVVLFTPSCTKIFSIISERLVGTQGVEPKSPVIHAEVAEEDNFQSTKRRSSTTSKISVDSIFENKFKVHFDVIILFHGLFVKKFIFVF